VCEGSRLGLILTDRVFSSDSVRTALGAVEEMRDTRISLKGVCALGNLRKAPNELSLGFMYK
jgi:hypothetical protein